MIKSAPYYWIVCDGCGANAMEETDYAAMSDHGAATDIAIDAGWQCVNNGPDYCEDCRVPQCEGCDRLVAVNDEDVCRDCWDDPADPINLSAGEDPWVEDKSRIRSAEDGAQ